MGKLARPARRVQSSKNITDKDTLKFKSGFRKNFLEAEK
jgi:hypothetical protein